jgi:hypothetical protein
MVGERLSTLGVLSDYAARYLAANPTYGWHGSK